ncbi:MAG: YdcF family protein [Firmicutes bacterium]|nr:YdcF family protein [Bacillota bacterium]
MIKEIVTRPAIGKLLRRLAAAVAAAAVLVAVLNLIVCLSVRSRIHSVEDCPTEPDCDCVIVLGCGVWGDSPSPLLQDRLDAAVALYRAGAAPKLLLSGDHGQQDYDEVSVMRRYVLEKGVASPDVFLDHAGFSTYETMYRARDVFGVEKAIVVTQKYHLYRALYDASAFGIEARGAVATGHVFASQLLWDIREAFARAKDLCWCLMKPAPTFRGEKIDIRGSGEVTLD